MRDLWNLVGFQPQNFQLDLGTDVTEPIHDATMKDNNKFTPKIDRPIPSAEDKTKYDGISIKNFPKETKKVDIIDFLKTKGLPDDFSTENVELGTHGNVEIVELPPQLCQELINNIHFVETRSTFFGKPIYCRPTRNLTPEKPEAEEKEPTTNEQTKLSEAATVENNAEVKEKDLMSSNEDVEFEFEENQDGDGFIFPKIDSKLLDSEGESSSEESEDESAKRALKFRKDAKATPATKKADKRSRATPNGNSETKIGKKTKIY